MEVAVSFIKGNLSMKDNIKKINETKAKFLHVDYMDGKFVPNKTFTFNELVNWTKDVYKPLHVHLMCFNPEKWYLKYASLNTDVIIIHYESVKDLGKQLDLIHSFGIKAGVAINPETNVEEIIPYLNNLEEVLVMSVNPGFGGQEFIDVSAKIKELADYRLNNNLNYVISVDGGINDETSLIVKEAGVDILVSGSYICSSNNLQKQIDTLLN